MAIKQLRSQFCTTRRTFAFVSELARVVHFPFRTGTAGHQGCDPVALKNRSAAFVSPWKCTFIYRKCFAAGPFVRKNSIWLHVYVVDLTFSPLLPTPPGTESSTGYSNGHCLPSQYAAEVLNPDIYFLHQDMKANATTLMAPNPSILWSCTAWSNLGP